ncbi:MAG: HAD hydrolase-like protein [Clostridia bacterium]|nr:HAD hydrolase-like protein [Clostridia bacterium]
MSIQPDFFFSRVEDITSDFLKENNIRLLILDADATLIQAQDDKILPQRVAWVDSIRAGGIRVMVGSNGKTHRIEKAFGDHKIEAYGYSLKPLPFRLHKHLKGYKKREVLLVGDQFFTDILCAKALGIRSVMVEPYGEEKGTLMGFRRALEKIIVKRK